MNKHFITFLFLLAAAGLYAAGVALPATGLLLVGALLEGVFWFRIVCGRRTGKTSQPAE